MPRSSRGDRPQTGPSSPAALEAAERNPFTPGFGLVPRVLALQGTPVEDFAAALAGRRGAGERSVLIAGARGVGKTVLLGQLREVAARAGWRTLVLHTSSASMVEELRGGAVDLLREVDPEAEQMRATSAEGGAFGVRAGADVEFVDRYAGEKVPLGRLLERLAALLTRDGGGLLVSVDEVQSADHAQLREVTQHLQDLIGAGHGAGFLAAGIRTGVDELLAHPGTTFLRRAHRIDISSVDVGTAAEVIRQTVADTSRSITPAAAVRAGEISHGYPYLIQVIGAETWARAGDASTIEIEDVDAARAATIDAMVVNVHGPALRDVTGRRMDYLQAMLEDEGPSAVGDVAARLGLDTRAAGVHRARLIGEELVQAAGHGRVELALPYLREALERVRETGSTRRAAAPAQVTRPVRRNG